MTSAVPSIKAIYTAEGNGCQSLSETFWNGVQSITLVNSTDGSPASMNTRVRAAWSDESLFLRFECQDSELYGTFKMRDDPIFDEEVVEFFIAPGENDPVEYREFEVSPFGVLWDGIVTNPGLSPKTFKGDSTWNAESFSVSINIHPDPITPLPACRGWTAEVRVDFCDLSHSGLTPEGGDVWRANFYRIKRKPRTAYWAWSPTMVKPAAFHAPKRFGRLVFSR